MTGWQQPRLADMHSCLIYLELPPCGMARRSQVALRHWAEAGDVAVKMSNAAVRALRLCFDL